MSWLPRTALVPLSWRQRRPAHRRAPVSLHLEALEGRQTPSVSVVPQSFTTNQYTALSISQDQLLAGDSGNGVLSIGNPTQPANANLVDNHNGTFTFTPAASFNGSTTFQYDVRESGFPLTPSGGAQVSFSVAIDGDTAVVGTPFQTVNGQPGRGAAYVFVRTGTTWTQQTVLTAAGSAYDRFGYAVAISGDTIVVGSPFQDVNGQFSQGAAYVFVRMGTTWSQQAELTTPADQPQSNFGASVAVDGDTAVALVPVGPPVGSGNLALGAAYVFVRTGTSWTPQAVLTNPQATSYISNVGLSGDTIVFAETSSSTGPRDSVSVFTRSDATVSPPAGVPAILRKVFAQATPTWSQQAQLEIDGIAGGLSVSGDTFVVGVEHLDGTDSDVAEVFVRLGGSWSQQAVLRPSDATHFDDFGQQLAVSGDSVLIAAEGHNQGQGADYVFQRSGSTWTQQEEFLGPALESGSSRLGTAVAIQGNTALIEGGDNGGGVTVHELGTGTATATATIVVSLATAALAVAPAALPDASAGSPYSSPTFMASGGAASGYTFHISGVLPPGLTFDSAAAKLVGTPTQVGSFPGIIVAASDSHGGSGSQVYSLTFNVHAFIRSLYRTVLGRAAENPDVVSYWEDVFERHVPAETDPYLYVAQGFWTSQEHRWREVEGYYHDFLGRDLDLRDDYHLGERQYWTNQFLFAQTTEAEVIGSFLTSPEYLSDHRADAALTNVLNTDLLGGAATTAHRADWTGRLSALDAQRAGLQAQAFATAEDYQAHLGIALGSYAGKTGVVFDALNAGEYAQAALDHFYLAFVHRASTTMEKQALLGLRDPSGNPLPLGSLAEMILASPEYRNNAVKSAV